MNLNFQTRGENFSSPPSSSLHGHFYNTTDLRSYHLIHEAEYSSKDGASKKTVRDPQSHRIIEKRRRDRMNNCLADLSKLIPTNYFKKGRGRIEKTEIIEMAIKHIKHLEAHAKVSCSDINRCELRLTEEEKKEEFRHGFRESISEVMRFLVEMHGLIPSDPLCQGLVNHLRDHLTKIIPHSPGCVTMMASLSTSSITSSIATEQQQASKQPLPCSSSISSSCSSSSTATMTTTSTSTAASTVSTIVVNHRPKLEDTRERSTSISSVLSESTIQSAIIPVTFRSGSSSVIQLGGAADSMEIEPSDDCYPINAATKMEIGSLSGAGGCSEEGIRLRELLSGETNTAQEMEPETEVEMTNSMITSAVKPTSSSSSSSSSPPSSSSSSSYSLTFAQGSSNTSPNYTSSSNKTNSINNIKPFGSSSSSSSSSSPSIGSIEVNSKNCVRTIVSSFTKKSSDSNGLTRSDSPSSENRFYKKGIKDRFQSDMKHEYKRPDCGSNTHLDPISGCYHGSGSGSQNSKGHHHHHYHHTHHQKSTPTASSIEGQHVTNLAPNQRTFEGKHLPPSFSRCQHNITNVLSSVTPSFSSTYFPAINLHNIGKVFKYKDKIITSLPAFALHPNGTFYIPLTINPQLISHWFASPETDDLYSVLHPVNIPVNFNYIQKLNHSCPIESAAGASCYPSTKESPPQATQPSSSSTANGKHSSGSSHLLLTTS